MLPPALVPAQEDASFCSGGWRDKGGGRGGGGEGGNMFAFLEDEARTPTTPTGLAAAAPCRSWCLSRGLLILHLAEASGDDHGHQCQRRLWSLPCLP
ncbi:Os01g0534101 [Oryza sativa Japonica Group]|uniref:Os01g0534101 protein n=1 Tax=Oryza sativa subsp. japonica TaxID=39947 RepID=A0A0P0V3W6_ORYSJ|nr:Os01g0534101 [Oryza sativa Japonica Group]